MKIHQRKKRRGSILLLVLFLLIILAMMGSAFSILLPVEMQNAKRDRANIQTAYAADAGILWVMDQLDTVDTVRDGPDGWKALEGHTTSIQPSPSRPKPPQSQAALGRHEHSPQAGSAQPSTRFGRIRKPWRKLHQQTRQLLT